MTFLKEVALLSPQACSTCHQTLPRISHVQGVHAFAPLTSHRTACPHLLGTLGTILPSTEPTMSCPSNSLPQPLWISVPNSSSVWVYCNCVWWWASLSFTVSTQIPITPFDSSYSHTSLCLWHLNYWWGSPGRQHSVLSMAMFQLPFPLSSCTHHAEHFFMCKAIEVERDLY